MCLWNILIKGHFHLSKKKVKINFFFKFNDGTYHLYNAYLDHVFASFSLQWKKQMHCDHLEIWLSHYYFHFYLGQYLMWFLFDSDLFRLLKDVIHTEHIYISVHSIFIIYAIKRNQNKHIREWKGIFVIRET